MSLTRSFELLIWIFVLKSFFANAANYEFVFDNDEIFDKCNDIPGNNGMLDLMDVSNIIVEYTDGQVHLEGDMIVIWDVQTTDRIELKGELFKFQRGDWQPTMLNMYLKDFCKEQFRPGTIWHSIWTNHIKPDNQKCLNTKEHKYHYDPVDIDTTMTLPGNMEGHHKVRVQFQAFDKKNIKNPVSICFEMIGEIIKLK